MHAYSELPFVHVVVDARTRQRLPLTRIRLYYSINKPSGKSLAIACRFVVQPFRGKGGCAGRNLSPARILERGADSAESFRRPIRSTVSRFLSADSCLLPKGMASSFAGSHTRRLKPWPAGCILIAITIWLRDSPTRGTACGPMFVGDAQVGVQAVGALGRPGQRKRRCEASLH